MGLKHLRETEQFLKKRTKRYFSMTEIRDSVGMNYETTSDVLAYLLNDKKIKKIIRKGIMKYQWNAKNG